MPRDQKNELLEHGLCGEEMLVNYLITPNLGKVLARENHIRTAKQGSEKAVKLFQIHRALVPKALENLLQAVKLCVA